MKKVSMVTGSLARILIILKVLRGYSYLLPDIIQQALASWIAGVKEGIGHLPLDIGRERTECHIIFSFPAPIFMRMWRIAPMDIPSVV